MKPAVQSKPDLQDSSMSRGPIRALLLVFLAAASLFVLPQLVQAFTFSKGDTRVEVIFTGGVVQVTVTDVKLRGGLHGGPVSGAEVAVRPVGGGKFDIQTTGSSGQTSHTIAGVGVGSTVEVYVSYTDSLGNLVKVSGSGTL
jgi:hypothetical protein